MRPLEWTGTASQEPDRDVADLKALKSKENQNC